MSPICVEISTINQLQQRQEFPHFEHVRPTLSPKNNEVNKLDVAWCKPTSQPAIPRLNSSPNSLLSGVLARSLARWLAGSRGRINIFHGYAARRINYKRLTVNQRRRYRDQAIVVRRSFWSHGERHACDARTRAADWREWWVS